MGSVRVAIVGVGNCATSLDPGRRVLQGRRPDGAASPGSCTSTFGDYHVSDVEFVAAFDVDAKKVGNDLSEAINASENNTIKIADVPTARRRRSSAARPSTVSASTTARPSRSPTPSRSTSSQALQGRRGRRPRLLPAGGLGGGRQVLRAVRDRRRRGLRQRAARLHRLRPRVGQEVRGRRRPDRRRRHQEPGRRHHHPPRDGQALRGPRRACWTAPTSSTSAATWTSRTCSSATAWSPRRSPRPRP